MGGRHSALSRGGYGLSVHWGLAALCVRGGGWIYYQECTPGDTYRKRMDRFKPVHFVAGEWADLMVQAGQRFLIIALVVGRRASCHTICWMAPFMILGRMIRNVFRWPVPCLVAEPASRIDCMRCTRVCPMSLDVNQMVRAADMENAQCILCRTRVDICPKGVIRYSFSSGRQQLSAVRPGESGKTTSASA